MTGAPDEAHAALDDPDRRRQTAIELGRRQATEYTAAIAARLPRLISLDHSGFVVALELMGDPSAVPALLARLADAPDTMAFDLHHALVRLTGRDPLVPLSADFASWAANIRKTWRTASMPAEPALSGLQLTDPALATFTLDQGRGAITTDYDPPRPGSVWPRWDKTIQQRGRPLYRAGSDCGTCEAFLGHLGWPPDRAFSASSRLRTALADVPVLTPGLLDALAPMLEGLRTGHYQLRLTDLDLERVTDAEKSWLVRRQEFREGDFFEESSGPGVTHFQLRHPIPGRTPGFGVFLPTQPLDALAQDTVDRHRAAIDNGARPAAILLTWVEDRYVEAECEERVVFGLVLDGHHKLAAYAEAGVPAKAVLVHRLEDTTAAVLDELTWP